MEQALEQRIRERAYEIWHAHGCAEGCADVHWLMAEQEVLSSSLPLATGRLPVLESGTPRKPEAARGKNRAARRASKSMKSSLLEASSS